MSDNWGEGALYLNGFVLASISAKILELGRGGNDRNPPILLVPTVLV